MASIESTTAAESDAATAAESLYLNVYYKYVNSQGIFDKI